MVLQSSRLSTMFRHWFVNNNRRQGGEESKRETAGIYPRIPIAIDAQFLFAFGDSSHTALIDTSNHHYTS
jgi:hypothetical protein